MSEEQEKQESESVAPPAAKYFVHNAARSRHNRSLRAAAASHQGLKQYIGGGQHRLIRGRPVALTEEKLKEYLDELKEKFAAGLIHVTTTDGHHVDLETLEVVKGIPSPPMPSFPTDSAANDKPWGEKIPPYVGDDQNSLPAVLPEGKLPEVLETKAAEERAAAEAEDEAALKAIADAGDEEVDPTGDTKLAGKVSSGKSRRNK
jgi:hypothetical protein